MDRSVEVKHETSEARAKALRHSARQRVKGNQEIPMTESMVDHEARRDIAVVRAKQDTHERYCEERGRKTDLFETEMRAAISTIAEKISDGNSRIHQRLDAMWKTSLGVLLTVIIAGGGWFLVQIWERSQ